MTWYPKLSPPSKKISKQLCAKFALESEFYGFDAAFLAELFNVSIKTVNSWLAGKRGVSPYHLQELQLTALYIKLRES